MRGRGFTIVEMMVVVGIVAMLAAIAIPSLHAMTMKARRAEAHTVVDGLVQGVAALAAAHDYNEIYPGIPASDAEPCPRAETALDKAAVPWGNGFDGDCTLRATTAGIPGSPNVRLGVRPDGTVRCAYLVGHCDNTAVCGPNHWQWGEALCDVDGDDVVYRMRDYRPLDTSVSALNDTLCSDGSTTCF